MDRRLLSIASHLSRVSSYVSSEIYQTDCSASVSRNCEAATCTTLEGPLEVLPFEHEELGNEEVRIGVRACGINFADILQCQGKYQIKMDPPFVPGTEIAGVVLAVGTDVSNVSVGDKVIALVMGGGFATEAVVNSTSCMLLPRSTTDEKMVEAAALVINYGTAHMALTRRANAQPGETLFITAAAGGVGLAAVELGKVMGLRVIAAAGGPDKLAIAASKGADHLIDYRAEGVSLKNELKRLTGGKGVDVALDMVGGDVFEQTLRGMAWEGRLVTIGYASGKIPKIAANLTLVKNCAVMGLFWGAYMSNDPQTQMKSTAQLISWWSQGVIQPHISGAYPLRRINDAFQHISTRQSTGKVVITMKP